MPRSRRRLVSSARPLVGVAALACAVIAGQAWADVLEIGPQGAVVTYAVPAVFTVEGFAPIQAQPAPRKVQAAPASADVAGVIAEAAQRYAVPSDLMRAVAWRESGYRQTAVSGRGAIGVMQLMSGTARQLGVDPYDLRQNIHGGAAYLSQMLTRYKGDTGLALAAYNAGPGAVDRYAGAPPYKETKRYVADILARIAAGPAPTSPLILGR